MEKEIMKALVVRDTELLRAIFADAKKGNVYIKPELMDMMAEYIKTQVTH